MMSQTAGKGGLRSAIVLAVIAAICTGLVALTYEMTRDQISANKRAFLERSLSPALAGLEFDNQLLDSVLLIPEPNALPGKEAAIVYRAWLQGSPVAALFVVTAQDGYSGAIRLLIGIDVHGKVTAVRILEHRETPGLGDGIEAGRSNWIHQFVARSMGNPPATGWAIRRDGGEFEQLTGASVTPRAVIKAIRETLLYFEAHQEIIFAAPMPNKESGE